VTIAEIPQNVRTLSNPMKELEALVISGRFHHNGNPVLTWMASNVVCHTDVNDNIFPRKLKPEYKIDGIVATLTALNRALATQFVVTPAYQPYQRIMWL